MSKNNKLHLGVSSLKVKYMGQNVGILALTNNKKVAFSYDKEWLVNGFSISPFSLPLEEKVFVPDHYHFDGHLKLSYLNYEFLQVVYMSLKPF